MIQSASFDAALNTASGCLSICSPRRGSKVGSELASSGWAVTGGRDAIQKTYQFENFVSAFGWMTKVGLVAEKMDHHPEWFNVYGTVDVTLSTHDAGPPPGALSERDLRLAKAMDELC